MSMRAQIWRHTSLIASNWSTRHSWPIRHPNLNARFLSWYISRSRSFSLPPLARLSFQFFWHRLTFSSLTIRLAKSGWCPPDWPSDRQIPWTITQQRSKWLVWLATTRNTVRPFLQLERNLYTPIRNYSQWTGSCWNRTASILRRNSKLLLSSYWVVSVWRCRGPIFYLVHWFRSQCLRLITCRSSSWDSRSSCNSA